MAHSLGLHTVPKHQLTTSWTKRQCQALDWLSEKYYLVANPAGSKHVLHCCDLGDHEKVIIGFTEWDDVLDFVENNQ